eukprot:847162_1
MDRLMQCNDEGKPQLTMEEKILQKKRQTKRRKGGQSVIESQNIHDDEERQLTTKSGQSVDLSQESRVDEFIHNHPQHRQHPKKKIKSTKTDDREHMKRQKYANDIHSHNSSRSRQGKVKYKRPTSSKLNDGTRGVVDHVIQDQGHRSHHSHVVQDHINRYDNKSKQSRNNQCILNH